MYKKLQQQKIVQGEKKFIQKWKDWLDIKQYKVQINITKLKH